MPSDHGNQLTSLSTGVSFAERCTEKTGFFRRRVSDERMRLRDCKPEEKREGERGEILFLGDTTEGLSTDCPIIEIGGGRLGALV